MKHVCYVALAIFTFAVGIGISPIRFYPELIACGRNNSSTSYRSSYLMQTTRSYITYDTEDEARSAFSKALSKALTVYDVSPKVNSEGKLIEDRAVYLTYHPVNDEYYVQIVWREGQTLNFIHSRSYTHVMEFERQDF
ncbi:MAG TPA: hypothetical protein VFR51_16360 [Pyrinomonadaceae bacterium]|nr:hypothetical protein [Pyrinomonadaceae bacterium]